MRIVAGMWRGRVVDAPKGRDTRPTTDRVKESLMSTVNSAVGFEDAVVLDAFAGSGQLGFEALSRGASSVVFCEHAQAARRVIQANGNALGADRSTYAIRAADVLKAPPHSPQRPYTIVFLDPPYAYDPQKVLTMMEELDKSGSLDQSVVITYEHDISKPLDGIVEQAGPFTLVQSKRYGDIAIDVIRKADL